MKEKMSRLFPELKMDGRRCKFKITFDQDISLKLILTMEIITSQE